MDWLHNLIANMPGPQFLFLYGLVVALTVAVCSWWLRQSDPTTSLPVLRVPSTPDPYEIAYLRGGENELLRVVLFRLLQEGALRVIPKKINWFGSESERIERGECKPTLSPLEKEVFGGIYPNTAKGIFGDSGIRSKLEEIGNSYEQRLQSEQLLAGPEAKNRAYQTECIGLALILGLGGYKLVAALPGHSNVNFLIMMSIVAVGVLHRICSSSLTYRGRRYLQDLEVVFGPWKERASQVAESQLSLLVGIFGTAVPAGTNCDHFRQMFPKASANGGSCGDGGGGCGGCGGCD